MNPKATVGVVLYFDGRKACSIQVPPPVANRCRPQAAERRPRLLLALATCFAPCSLWQGQHLAMAVATRTVLPTIGLLDGPIRILQSIG